MEVKKLRVFIAPKSNNAEATGGIARVVEAQTRWLGSYGIEVVDLPEYADVLCVHAATWIEPTSRQRVVTHCHGLYWDQDKWDDRWHTQVNKLVLEALHKADAITCPSQWVANSLKRGLYNPLVIGHGIELDEWSSEEEKRGYVFWDKAREDNVCNPQDMSKVAELLPNVPFISTFGSKARNVQITGEMPHSEHKDFMQHAGVYLCTARETFGISILEALACGVPVVGWDFGGQSEILGDSDYKVGRLVPYGDYEQLAEAIDDTLHSLDPGPCVRLVRDKYQWKDVVSQYAELYKQVAAHTPERPKVSIIIPSYNLSKYLPEAINSALDQTTTVSCQVIVVDDCSTDDSYQIAKEFTEVTVVKTPHNMNMPGVLNLGLEYATGEYIMNLDADNILEPDIVAVLVNELDKHRDIDIAYGKLQFVLDDGYTPDRQVSGDGISAWPPPVCNADQQMQHKNQIPSTALVRRKLIDRLGGYRHRCFRIGEDPDFWCRAIQAGVHAQRVTDAVMLKYRMRNDSRSHVQGEWAWEAWYPNKYTCTRYVDSSSILVSFVIPVGPGHAVQGLEDALDSIYAQSVKDWECIVVNDTGSPLLRIPSWARVYTTDGIGCGVSVARNVGLHHARGKFFVPLDADDFLDPEFLSETLTTYKNHNTAGYVYTDWIKPESNVDVRIPDFECSDQLHNLHHAITCLYPMTDGKVVFDETMRVGEDWDFVLAMQAAGYKGIHCEKPLIYYRQSTGNNRLELIKNIQGVRKYLEGKWMGCGCSSEGVPPIDLSNFVGVQEQVLQGELVLLEFVKPDTQTATWTGKSTGYNYRFGSGLGHNVAYVHRLDAVEFLKRDEFALARSSNLASV